MGMSNRKKLAIGIGVGLTLLIMVAVLFTVLQSTNYYKSLVFDNYNINSCAELVDAKGAFPIQGVQVELTSCRDSGSSNQFCTCEYEPVGDEGCRVDSDCNSGEYCYNGQLCLDRQRDDSVCFSSRQCLSNFCNSGTHKCETITVETTQPAPTPEPQRDVLPTPGCEQDLVEECQDGTTAVTSECVNGELQLTGVTCDGEVDEYPNQADLQFHDKSPDLQQEAINPTPVSDNLGPIVIGLVLISVFALLFVLVVSSRKGGKRK